MGLGRFATVVPTRSRRLAGFDITVLSLYATGMTTGDVGSVRCNNFQ